jgi:hypothetical protein
MKANVGGVDRVLRFILGIFLLSLIFWGPKTYWGLVGIIPLLTSVVKFCPLYPPFKISTKKSGS